MVPIATFAKQPPSGERRLSAGASHSLQPNNQIGTSIPITTDCSSSPNLQTVLALSPGDQVVGTASLTSSDSNEASENENLHLQEQNSQFTKPITTVTITNSSQTFSFTAGTANDTLTACVDGIDSDDTASITITSITPPLFIFIQGIDTTLSGTGIPTNQFSFGQPGGIYPSLKSTYTDANFIMYSYNGDTGNGTPKSYACQDTFTSHIATYDDRLNTQIMDYLNSNPGNPNIYLVSHSMGGVVAFGYLAYLLTHGGLNGSIPNHPDAHLKGVITLDSPLGGIFNGGYFDQAKSHYQAVCPALVVKDKKGKVVKQLPVFSLEDLAAIFKTAPNTTPQGGIASIQDVLFPIFGGGAGITNQKLAESAHQSGVSDLTVENTKDFLFDPGPCTFGVVGNFITTQRIADEGSNSGIYGRTFKDGTDCGNNPYNAGNNHFKVLTNSVVEQGIMQFLPLGGTPSALTAA